MNSPRRALGGVLQFALCVSLAGLATIARGGQAPDTVTLKDGAVLQGKVMGRAPGIIVFKTVDGKIRKLAESDVRSVRSESKLRAEYGKRAAKLKRNDYAGHIALAKWCLQNALDKCAATEVSTACRGEDAAYLRAAARLALQIQRFDLAQNAASKGVQAAPDDPFLQAVAQNLDYLTELKAAQAKAKQALDAAGKQLAEHRAKAGRLEKLLDTPVEVVERQVEMRCRSCGGTGKGGGRMQARATIKGSPVRIDARLNCRSCMGRGVQVKKANVVIAYAKSAVEKDLAAARQSVSAAAAYAAKLDQLVGNIDRVVKRVVAGVLAEPPKAPERQSALLHLPSPAKTAPASPVAGAKEQQPANPVAALAKALHDGNLGAAYSAACAIGDAAAEGSPARRTLNQYYVVRKLAKIQNTARQAVEAQSHRVADCQEQLLRTNFMLAHQDKKCVWLRVHKCPVCGGRGTVSDGWFVSISPVGDPNRYSRPLPGRFGRLSSRRSSRRVQMPKATTSGPKRVTCPRCRGRKTVKFWEQPTAKALEAERMKLTAQLPRETSRLAKLKSYQDGVQAIAATACSALTDGAARMPTPAEVVEIESPAR